MSAIIDLTKKSIGNCIFLGKYIGAHGFDYSTRYIMSITVSNCQHCDEQQFRTLSWVRTPHNFLSSKFRFIHTSTYCY